MKSYYSEYASHCLRFYCRNLTMPENLSLADRRNWEAAHRALQATTEEKRDILIRLYKSPDFIGDAIRDLSFKTGYPKDLLWQIVTQAERGVADERGLI